MGEIRPGSKTLETVLKTDELYGHDGLLARPARSGLWGHAPAPEAVPAREPNSSYWLAFLEMPAGSVLTIRGRYPHGRYFQLALYRSGPDMGGYTATGEKFVDHEIESIESWGALAPDLRMEFLQEIREKHRIAIGFRLTGTHTGDVPGTSPGCRRAAGRSTSRAPRS